MSSLMTSQAPHSRSFPLEFSFLAQTLRGLERSYAISCPRPRRRSCSLPLDGSGPRTLLALVALLLVLCGNLLIG